MMAPNKCVGIDLGTTYSCVGVFQNGKVEIIHNEQGYYTTPSCVAYTDVERLIGESARQQGARNPTNTILEVKRLIGRNFKDPEIQKDIKKWRFTVLDEDGKPKIKAHYKKSLKIFSPEEISAVVLSKMKQIAETYLKAQVNDVVITVPAYFNDSQRQATIDAGRIAGLNVLKILNEPTAAAIAYGLDKNVESQKNILVYDLGGGTLDVSILNIGEDKIFEVKATSGDSHLGGVDFDNEMASHFLKMFVKEHEKDPSVDDRAMFLLRQACESAKRELSTAMEARIELTNFYQNIDFFASITRAKFENLCYDLFEKCKVPIEKALEDAKLTKKEIDDIVLVGGSTRIPKIQSIVRTCLNCKELTQNINADEAVAYGAAIQAAILLGDNSDIIKDIVLLDVTPLSLGTDLSDGSLSIIVPRNTCIPCSKKRTYTTIADDQNFLNISVYEGERHMVLDNRKLGNFQLFGIEKAAEGVPRIEITFALDDNGILKVSAVDTKTGAAKEININMDKGRLSDDEIRKMLQDREKYEEEDQEKLEIIEGRNELERCMYNVRGTIRDSEDTLSRADKVRLERIVTKVSTWLENHPWPSLLELRDIASEFQTKIISVMSKLP